MRWLWATLCAPEDDNRENVHLHYPCVSIHPPSLINDVLEGHDRASLEMHWGPWSSEFEDALGRRNVMNSEVDLVAVMERVRWCTGRSWSSNCGDALWGRDRASWEMQLDTEIEWTERCTGRPWLSRFGHACRGWDRVNSEMHSELWSSEFRDELAAGYILGRLEEYLEVADLEAVDGRHPRCWNSIYWCVNSKPWECDDVTLPFKFLWRTSWWQWIYREVRRELKLHSWVNSTSREWRDDKQCLV